MARQVEEILDFALITREHASRFSRMVVAVRRGYNDLKGGSEKAEPADSQLNKLSKSKLKLLRRQKGRTRPNKSGKSYII